jgi:catechol 2,3-dioxygenase-like lactoylglutathione lyase family enzyme
MKKLAVWLMFAVALQMQAQQRPAITGVAFVRFYSSDLAKSDGFYHDIIGLERVMGADSIARYEFNRDQWLELEKLPATDPGTRLVEVAFTTHNLRAMRSFLAANHVPIVSSTKTQIAVHDPEGYLIGFVQQDSMHGLKLPTRAPSRRIIHAGLIVKDRDAEDKFYRDLLGFSIYWERGTPDEKTHPVSMHVPDGSDWIEYMRNAGPSPDANMRGSLLHIALGVTDMDATIAWLAKNGCQGENCTKTRRGMDGKVQLNLFDPDLTRMEYMEFKPSGPVCCTGILGKDPQEVEDR